MRRFINLNAKEVYLITFALAYYRNVIKIERIMA